MASACSKTSQSMPRACSISAVTSPPIPPPTMMAFITQQRCNARPQVILALRGTRDQSPISHTVSALYGAAFGSLNARRIGQEMRMRQPLTLFDKIWAQHEILQADNGLSLLWIDRHYVHEGSFQGFDKVEARGEKVSRPDLTFGIADQIGRASCRERPIADPSLANMVRQIVENTAKHKIMLIGLDDPRQGIVHVVGPEQGQIGR